MNIIEELTGVSKMTDDNAIVGYVLEVMKDYECHTIETIAESVLDEWGIDVHGCVTASALGAVEDRKGYTIDTFGPYDIFDTPSRYKLVKIKEY